MAARKWLPFLLLAACEMQSKRVVSKTTTQDAGAVSTQTKTCPEGCKWPARCNDKTGQCEVPVDGTVPQSATFKEVEYGIPDKNEE